MRLRLTTVLALACALAAVALGAGCGGDDDETTTSTLELGTTGATGVSGATGATGENGAEADPIDFEEARTNLEEAGFNVEDQAGDDLAQETGDGTVNAVAGYRVFEPGESADVVIQQFGSADDAEVVAESLETGAFTLEVRDDIVLFAVQDQEQLLNEVASAASGAE